MSVSAKYRLLLRYTNAMLEFGIGGIGSLANRTTLQQAHEWIISIRMPDPMIACENLTKRFGHFTAADHFSVSLGRTGRASPRLFAC